MTGQPGSGIRALGVPTAPFKFARHCRVRLSSPRAPLVAPAALRLPALVEGEEPRLPTPLLAQPIGGGARPHVRRARLGSRQNVNEKEERDLKVLAAPAEDKCASFARSPPGRWRQRTAGRTDRHPNGCDPGPRAADARRAGSDGQAAAAARGIPRGPGALSAPGPTTSSRVTTRNHWVCSGPRPEEQRRLLSGYRSAAARLCSRCPAGFLAAAQRRDFSPLAGLFRARL